MKWFFILILSATLVACKILGPFAHVEQPVMIRSYRSGSQAVITKSEGISSVMRFLTTAERRWKRYSGGNRFAEVESQFQTVEKTVATVLVGPDWVIAIDPARDSFSTTLSKGEHDALLRLLGF
jgi:hypothetical protein